MKKISYMLIILAFTIGGYYLYQQNTLITKGESNDIKEIRIGAILPLTGRISFLGKPVQEALDLYINDNTGLFNEFGYDISIVYGDSKGNAKDAVNVLNSMIAKDNINVVLTFLTNVTLSINPIVEKKNIFTMALSVYPPVVENDVTVKLFYDFKTESELLVGFIKEKAYKNILIISSEDAASTYQYEYYYQPKLDSENISYDNVTFKVGEKNFKNIIPNNLNEYDAILLSGFGSDFPPILNTINTYNNLEVPIIAGIGMYEIKRSTPFHLVSNSVFAVPSFLLQNETDFRLFNEKFKNMYNHENNSFMAVFAYDNMKMLENLIKNFKLDFSNGKDIKQKAIKLENINGISGKIKINKNGESKVNISLSQFSKDFDLKKL